MDAKRRKLGAGKFERRKPVVRRSSKLELDGFEDEQDHSSSEEEKDHDRLRRPLGSEDDEEGESEEEDDEEGDDEDEEDEEDDDGDDDEEEKEPSSENLTFGQILKKQQKASAAAKERTGGVKAAKNSSRAVRGVSGLFWDTRGDVGGAHVSKDEDASADKTKTAAEAKPKPSKVARSSKHAPAEISSRFAVKRGRDWLSGDATIGGADVRPVEMRSRDPRFLLATMNGPASRADAQRTQRNYAFLNEYRDNEIQQLRESLAGADRAVKAARRKMAKSGKSGKSSSSSMQERLEAAEQSSTELRRALMSMESRKRDREAKEKEQAVLEEHKKRERELVRQGKKPFFLKRSEQRKQLLVDKFASMTEQQVDKAMDRRRKKFASREKKEMPMARRTA